MKNYKSVFFPPIEYLLVIFFLSSSIDPVWGQVNKNSLADNGQESRLSKNFNANWKFKIGDSKGAENAVFDDRLWELTSLPHSFSTPYFMSPEFYVGYGWYRKHFLAPKGFQYKIVSLEFEGVFQQAEIFVNGNFVGEHKGGYTGFSIDVTKALRPGDNIVSVRVNNLWNPQLAPRAGEHVFSGGIYRDVRLVVTNPIHVDLYGTFVQTPVVTKERAKVLVKTDVKNETKHDQNIQIRTDLVNSNGKVVASYTSSELIGAQSVKTITQDVGTIVKPLLWHPDHPYLYTAVTSISIANKIIDQYKTVFGVRTFRWTADKGFFLNGEHLYLRGANVHQDHAGWGDAVTNAGFFRDVKMVKDAGFNFIRGSHYPHDPAFVDACDRLGIIFWSENPFWGIGGSDNVPDGYWNGSAYPLDSKDTAAFEASVKQQFQEMVKMHRNHPSIAIWSVSNEPFFTAPHTVAAMRGLLSKLIKISHEIDPTRVAAVGGAQRPIDSNRIDKIGDVAGYNGDGSAIAIFQDPGIPNMVSEYGGTFSERPGKYEPGWGDLSKDNGEPVHPWRSGQSLWCAFDHGSIAGAGMAKLGIIDYFRIPKRAWYWYRNHYRGIPPPEWPKTGKPAALRLEADKRDVGTDGTDDVRVLVTVMDKDGKPLSNSPDVKFEVVSGPGEFPTGTSINFSEKSDIRIMDGQAAIELRSQFAGKSVIRATSPGLPAAELIIDFKGERPYRPELKVRDRPYIRFAKENQKIELQVFGRNNPTFASSFSQNHLPGYAADGDSDTWWQPNDSDAYPKWTLDTEKKLALKDLMITFPAEEVYQYKIEISDDQKTWKLISDLSDNLQKEKTKSLKNINAEGRYIRISFVHNLKSAISEVSVTGAVLQ
ncbi:glycoside hydrolase family 2 TIM barrel-domain containing protein [Chitinophaga sp.]|uniref:glycoside hydrolase family 2 protein n=1 Tax=Chitinophaga sp. TaxID=1869181 RepID=UPI0031DD5CB3